MKILFQRPKFYSLLIATNDGEESEKSEDLEDQNLTENDRKLNKKDRNSTEKDLNSNEKDQNSNEKGRKLTVGIVAGMLVCCLAWTLTIWFYCGIKAETEIDKNDNQPLQCSSVTEEFR